jgi:hypothetical protein
MYARGSFSILPFTLISFIVPPRSVKNPVPFSEKAIDQGVCNLSAIIAIPLESLTFVDEIGLGNGRGIVVSEGLLRIVTMLSTITAIIGKMIFPKYFFSIYYLVRQGF